MTYMQALLKISAASHERGSTREWIGIIASGVVMHYFGWQTWLACCAAVSVFCVLVMLIGAFVISREKQ